MNVNIFLKKLVLLHLQINSFQLKVKNWFSKKIGQIVVGGGGDTKITCNLII